MQAYFLWAATIMSAITFSVHTFVGGPRVAEPLLANSDLPTASKWLNYYCWHVTTILTFTMGGGYAYVALNPDRPELAVFLTIVTGASSLLSAAVARKGNINPFRFPSTWLFATVSLLGLAGLLST
ncbi:hypothetical protein UWK_01453 [Desulfocapsa sulfexigens DSM 10523]|uniref:Uncharacterized protein n=1 Tax=Desulfocapsa sulfexigens (strain DSM 10523 / SB164P1) TaxID=1167006 RepID=M1P3I1_DESSD|nr:hypothetical protein [Desulfocapsa sulfexigens]AGF78013.1 hypothetical protein UWK_01453 [Desulfocapsa sulfexigens DSM 10523]